MALLSPPSTHTLGECHGQLKHSFSGQTDFHRVELLREGATLYCSLPFATPGPRADACRVHQGVLSRFVSKVRGVLQIVSGRGAPAQPAETVLRQRVALHDVSHLVAVVAPTSALRPGTRGERTDAEHGTRHSILFYDPSTGSRRPLAFRLDHEFQRDVACLAFAPSASMSLALGCRNGLCVWNIDGWTKSPRAWMTFLQVPPQAPVTCLDWSPCGAHLASASSAESCVRVWDPSGGDSVTLSTPGLAPALLLRWSPAGGTLVAITAAGELGVWSTRSWARIASVPLQAMPNSLSFDARGAHLAVVSQRGRSMGVACLRMPSGDAVGLDLRLAPSLAPRLWTIPEPAAVAGAAGRLCAWDPLGGRFAIAVGPVADDPTAEGEPSAPDARGSVAASAVADDGSVGGEGRVAVYSVACDSRGPKFSFLDYVFGPRGAVAGQLDFFPSSPRGSMLVVAWSKGDDSDGVPFHGGEGITVGALRFYPFVYEAGLDA
mmetsp:Transcript_13657/g.43640  ORF Transcript_13657/g.43640 Transcript_13657/m.43640 type:complete len:491 (+) Transcript_13657:1-1473(+)